MVPDEYGGAGYDALSSAIILEEIARVDAAVALLVGSHNALCSGHILLAGTEEQKRRFLPPLARGEKLGAWALTDRDRVRTRARCGRAPRSRETTGSSAATSNASRRAPPPART